MRALRDGLAVVLFVAIAIRIAAELVTPALPLLTTVFFIVFVFTIAFGRRW